MAFSLANPGVQFTELSGLIPVRPDQTLNILFFIQGRSDLPGDFSPVTGYNTFETFLADCGSTNTVTAYEKQAVFSASLHHDTFYVVWLKTAADLVDALANTEFSALTLYPWASGQTAVPRNAAYTLLLPWVTANSGELFTEPMATTDTEGYVTATPSTAQTILDDLELISIESQNGHWRFYAPSLPSTFVDNDGTWYLSAAATAAAVLAARVSREGIRQPGAGRKCAISGVSPILQSPFTTAQINQLNAAKVNPIAKINGVWQPYAASTQAIQEAFVSSVARQIFNTIRKGAIQVAETLQFESIDGRGELYQAAQLAFGGLLYRLWADGALFGRTPDESYIVVCDDSNNPPEDLEAAILTVDLYAIPSPFSQQVKIVSVRKAIGSIGTTIS